MSRRRDTARSCAATTCFRTVDKGMLFCADHWWSLPEALRTHIVRSHRAGHNGAFRQAFAEAQDLIDAREFKPLFPKVAA